MDSRTDPQLLRDYAEHRSESAFSELVRRHVDFVYSAALRMVCDQHLAEDVTQGVFMALAQKAWGLGDRPTLSGWLHRTARNLAANAVRSEVRRRSREQEAAAMNLLQEPDISWKHIDPHLDAALGELNDSDRDALLLRYFEGKSTHEIAQSLSISEDAAQKRVLRAVDRLREIFGKRGITIGAGAIVVLITANAIQAAPISLATAISAATTVISAQASNLIVATKAIAVTTLQKALAGATIAIVAASAGYGVYHTAQLQDKIENLQRRQSPLADRIARLQGERDDNAQRITSLEAENEHLKIAQNPAELMQLREETVRLRREVTQLQNDSNRSVEKTAGAVAAKVNLLKQSVARMPEQQIPEFQFLTAKDWADVAWNFTLNTNDDVREAMSQLRQKAEDTFLNDMMKDAFKKYLAANNNILPGDLSQLKPFFNAPVTDAMLQRYQLEQAGPVDPNAELVKLAVIVDPEYDSNHGMSINAAWGTWFNTVKSSIERAANSFSKDNNGELPTNPSQLTAYLKQPIEAQTVQKYLDQIHQ